MINDYARYQCAVTSFFKAIWDKIFRDIYSGMNVPVNLGLCDYCDEILLRNANDYFLVQNVKLSNPFEETKIWGKWHCIVYQTIASQLHKRLEVIENGHGSMQMRMSLTANDQCP